MNFALAILYGNTYGVMLLVIFCGIVTYMVDYRSLQTSQQYKAEMRFSKVISLVYISIGVVSVVGLKILDMAL